MLNFSTLIPRPPHIITGYLKLDLARAVCLGLKQTIKKRHATREPPKASGLASQTLKTKLFRSCNSAAKRRRMENLVQDRLGPQLGRCALHHVEPVAMVSNFESSKGSRYSGTVLDAAMICHLAAETRVAEEV